MRKRRGRYSGKLKFQVVLEALKGEKTPAQIGKASASSSGSAGVVPSVAGLAAVWADPDETDIVRFQLETTGDRLP